MIRCGSSQAGTGIVPKWVSSIGLISISAAIAAVLPWIVAILKAIVEVVPYRNL
jgi:hypothetical protein